MESPTLLLVRPNDKKQVYFGIKGEAVAVDPPYWLAVMGGYMHDAGIEVALLDAEADDLSPEEAALEITRIAPKLIGILTIGNNVTASTWKMVGASLLCDALTQIGMGTPVFLWGNHPSALPERTLREEKADYVIVGEGFDTVADLARHHTEGTPSLDAIQGLRYLDNGRYAGNDNLQIIKDLNALPVNGWDLFPPAKMHFQNHLQFSFEDLAKRNRYGVILTSLGCPYNCSFCAVKAFSGNSRTVRHKTPEKALEEVDYWVKEQNVYYLRILDECFTINRAFVMEFCRLLIERQYDLSIWAYSRVDLVDEELLTVMRRAGIKWICYGMESSNPAILKNVNKVQHTGTQLRDVIDLTHRCGLSIVLNIMFGLPGESLEDMRETLRRARELNCEYPNIYCTMAYPGSRLYREVLRDHPQWLPETWAGYTQLGYETKPLPTEFASAEEILAFRDQAFVAYFEDNPAYFAMIRNQFGEQAALAIEKMLEGKPHRKILGM